MLTTWSTIEPERRKSVIYLLKNFTDDILLSRDLESAIHAMSTTKEEYIDKSKQIITNLKNNSSLQQHGVEIVNFSDKKLAQGTIVECIERESNERNARFEQMLHEKYNLMNDKSYKETLKCRRCGSSEVSWEQKQTRSADEASTVFCTCTKCKNRWTMR